MKTLICILLVAYCIFGPTEDKNNAQNAELKEQTKFKSQSNFLHDRSTDGQVTLVDINGNVVKPKSETK